VKALIVPDKFKGTLTASEAAQAMAIGWRRARPEDHLELLPMSDGGDGFGEIMSALIGAEPIVTDTMDAAHRPISASWWWHIETATAIIESARIIGLAQLPRGKYHPFDLDTRGLGIVLCGRRTAALASASLELAGALPMTLVSGLPGKSVGILTTGMEENWRVG